ncbi:MAG TPA: chemotaxis protein CheB [Anaeromyxobacter sp.]|nr:chemotaxis protein CheB [Anaeromyxobacter sp.]
MLRRAGGYTAAQSAATSVVYGMPRGAIDSGAAAHEPRSRRHPGGNPPTLAKRPGVISRPGMVVATRLLGLTLGAESRSIAPTREVRRTRGRHRGLT